MECFAEIRKMVDKVKMVEKDLEIVSQTNQRMRDLQARIKDIEEWRSMEKNVPSILLVIKSYDISVHILATIECQDLDSRFKENARKDLGGMMDLYGKSIYDIQRYIQWPEINFEDKHLVPYALFKKLEDNHEKIKVDVQTK